ncbi:methyltransferase domain-containing protein [Lichenihabitans psoromatis]|uniref:methyltransferase domain-containing protein n=1 Tax=Lichenihabitans psoromatis TaxID=2528642 RepID=UPI001035B054|nr:methyltransferase domain-containing protein [Lichenihabitans psoromatis]
MPDMPLITRTSRTDGNFTVPRPENPLTFTGERMTTTMGGQIEFEHYHRYCLARDLCLDLDVLDVASGEGYGSALLSRVARNVVGVEIDATSVTHAKANYSFSNLKFLLGDALELPLSDKSVDVVVSFETLEHVADQEKFLLEVRRVLRPGGLVVVSTPDRSVYSAPGSDPNPYHVLELTGSEFHALLDAHFAQVAVLAQRPVLGSVMVSPDKAGWRSYERRGVQTIEATQGLARAHYLVALATDGSLPVVPSSIYLDRRSVHDVVEHALRLPGAEASVVQLEAHVAEARAETERVSRLLEQRQRDVLEAERAWAEAERSRAEALTTYQAHLFEVERTRGAAEARHVEATHQHAIARVAAETRVADLKRELTAAQNRLSLVENDRAVAELRHTEALSQGEAALSAATTQTSDLERELAAAQNRLSLVENDRAVAELRHTEALSQGEAALGAATTQTSDLERELAAARETLHESDAEIDKLARALQESSGEALQLRKALADIDSDSGRSRDEAQTRITELEQARQAERHGIVLKADAALSDARRTASELASRYNVSRSEVIRLKLDLEQARQHLLTAERNRTEEQKERATLQQTRGAEKPRAGWLFRSILNSRRTSQGRSQQAVVESSFRDAAPVPFRPALFHDDAERRTFVFDVYRVFLRRDPEQHGLDHHVDNLRAGVPLIEVIETFINSDEYLEVRQSDRAGENGAALAKNAPELNTFRDDAERQGFVAHLYRVFLGRDPDPHGLEHYTARLRAELPLAEIVASFPDSDEYRELLNRIPSVKQGGFHHEDPAVSDGAVWNAPFEISELAPSPASGKPKTNLRDAFVAWYGSSTTHIPPVESPVVSIIIPAYRGLPDLENCLRSLAAHYDTEPSFEVIVVDDCPWEPVLWALPNSGGLIKVSNTENLGFLLSCNRGASLARGQYLCFLNSDTIVYGGWLKRLVEVFDDIPKCRDLGWHAAQSGRHHSAGRMAYPRQWLGLPYREWPEPRGRGLYVSTAGRLRDGGLLCHPAETL